jgi:hypothetical protein
MELACYWPDFLLFLQAFRMAPILKACKKEGSLVNSKRVPQQYLSENYMV